MSGFLARVAARAVGEAPLARPKLASIFEATRADGGLEAVDTEVAAAPRPRGEASEPAPAPHSGEAPQRAGTEPGPAAATAHRREPAAPASEAPVSREFMPQAVEHASETGAAARREPTLSPPVGAPTAAAQPVPPRPAVAATSVSGVTAVHTAAAVPVPTATLAFSLRQAPAPAQSPSGATEPPAVRVHIGRLEVRANLQEAPPQRPRRAQTTPPGPSLSDYLRGRRTAR